MVNAIRTSILIQLYAVLGHCTISSFPYNPSYIWAPSSDNVSLAYVLSPKAPDSTALQLRALNVSAEFDVLTPRFAELTAVPPFLSSVGFKSIIPIPDTKGFPVVFTGDCRSDLSEIWRFVPGSHVLGGHEEWSRSLLRSSGGDGKTMVTGPNYLSAAITFPDLENKTRSDVYIFGGMCPTAAETDMQDWVSAAEYSRTMISLLPAKAANEAIYELSILPNLSPPVKEAGFSMTPLLPAHSNSSSGRTLRQQSFALIGGHTENAFLNMSRIALFSLPERTWSYVSINSQKGSSTQRNTVASADEIQPRSGHTAVLSPAGDKVIILGGWVGDITNPAQPQLAILHLGEDYGGSGNWRWSIPDTSASGLGGNGLFGHGAAMLPGGIMAVVGGYEIPVSSKRSIIQPRDNSRMYLFNVTSETWSSSYTPLQKANSSKDKSGPLSSPGQKVGLGVGLGIGVSAAAAGLIIVFCVRTRHKRAYRKTREQELRNLALGAERPHISLDGPSGGLYQPMVQVDRKQTGFNARGGNNLEAEDGDIPAERTSLLVGSSVQRMKKGIHSGVYRPPAPDDPRRTTASGKIHPIDEGEEYDDTWRGADTDAPTQGHSKSDSRNSVMSDPFKDPPSPVKACLPPPIIPSRNGNPTLEFGQGFGSSETKRGDGHGRWAKQNDKADRTLSNLSESSGTSASASSYRTSSMGLNHSQPNLGADDYIFPPPKLDRKHNPENHGDKENIPPFGAGASSLLPSDRADAPSPSKTKAREWVGSVRRALSLAKRSENDRTNSLGSDLAHHGDRSTSSSPTKSFHSAQENSGINSDGNGKAPRRAVSTSSTVLRQKKGAKDWDVKQTPGERSSLLRRGTIDGTMTLNNSACSSRGTGASDSINYEDDDEDWDVEAAAQGRVAQVTFTVPKEKLRVVNVGVEDGLDDADDDDEKQRRKTANETCSKAKEDAAEGI